MTPTPSPIPQGDAYEPDNTYRQAKTIGTTGVAQTHTIHLARDVDWMKFNATKGVNYNIETLNLRNGADTVLELYDRNGVTRLALNDDWNGSLASRIVWTAPRTATYFIRVRDFNTRRAGVGYDVRISAAVTDAYEPNDIPSRAKSIGTTGGIQTHTIHRAGDVDWMKFSATVALRYTIETLNLRNGADTVLELYSTNGTTRLAVNDDRSGASYASRLVWTAPRTGTYYIRVRDYSSLAAGVGYDVRITRVTTAAGGEADVAADMTADMTAATLTSVVMEATSAETKPVAVVSLPTETVAAETVVAVTLYGEELPFHVDTTSGQLLVTLPTTLKPGTHDAQVWGNAGLLGVAQVDGPTLAPRVYLPNLNR